MPRARITRAAILDAAFRLVEEEGHEALTARRLASALGCSTQPLLYHFESIGQIADETYRRTDERHTAYLMDGLEREEDPLLALGLRYIRFGAEHRTLFRFLFQSNRFSDSSPEELTRSDGAEALIGVVSAASGLPRERAAALFQALFVAVHGYASLLANNAMRWEPDKAEDLLVTLYEKLTKER